VQEPPRLWRLLDYLAQLFRVLFDMFAQRDDLSETAARFDEEFSVACVGVCEQWIVHVGINANRLTQSICSTSSGAMVRPSLRNRFLFQLLNVVPSRRQVPVRQQPLNTLLPKSRRLSCCGM
jgi:hypothetical protein